MKVGIISDIHGNHLALREVLKAAGKERVSRLFVLGDLVGYYYHPDIVMDMLSHWDHEIIRGNHEILLQVLAQGKIDPSEVERKYGHGHEQALRKLDPATLDWLFSQPCQKSAVVDGVAFQLNHGSPWDMDEYLYPDSGNNKLEKCNSAYHDFVLVGHSHYSFSYQCSGSLLINCGSVGQSREKSSIAYWALVDTDSKKFAIKATPYDSSPLQKEVQTIDPGCSYPLKILIR
jgi:predicted phosphodiesterase